MKFPKIGNRGIGLIVALILIAVIISCNFLYNTFKQPTSPCDSGQRCHVRVGERFFLFESGESFGFGGCYLSGIDYDKAYLERQDEVFEIPEIMKITRHFFVAKMAGETVVRQQETCPQYNTAYTVYISES